MFCITFLLFFFTILTFLTQYLSWLHNKTIGEAEQSPHTSSSSSTSPSEMNRSSKNNHKLQRVQSERVTGSSGLKLTQSYKRINDHGKKIDVEKEKNRPVQNKDQKGPGDGFGEMASNKNTHI